MDSFYTQVTSAAVSSDAVLVELQTQSHFLAMIFWMLVGFAVCVLFLLVWKFFDIMFFKHMS